ncbi:tripartite tricarboxylate transporter TctB family protein [Derxia lacustris]|uniref:tripartite tricarboxylate transporter TctB family protein n=1 Tax=Derxia lacustris TaxID=764842 RepID=UPI000A16F0A0|nr:tripartite tricarboxylate transporter TctB family protein [Derxia lacustris]
MNIDIEHRAPDLRGGAAGGRLAELAARASARGLGLALACAALGGAAIVLAQDYALGRAGRMGPGYFPTLLGWLLVGAALAVPVSGPVEGDDSAPGNAPGNDWPAELRALGGVTGAILLFGLSVERLGLAGATLLLVLVSGLASAGARLRELALLGVALALLASLLFVAGLGVNLPVLPA